MAGLQTAQDMAHLFAHRNGFLHHRVALMVLGTRQNIQPCFGQIGHLHGGKLHGRGQFQRKVHPREIAACAGQCVQIVRGQFHLFVGQQAAHQFRARVGFFFGLLGRFGQQQPRFDFNQHRRHQQIFRRQIKLFRVHLRDIGQILLGNPHHRNIQHVDILLADKVQQQVQRPFKAVQHNLQGVGRNKQIGRHVGHRLPENIGNGLRHFLSVFNGRVQAAFWRIGKQPAL